MELNKIELVVMNNPLRRWIQKYIEFKTFKKLLNKNGFDLKGKVILDAGCGSGYSTSLIETQYTPKELLAFDLMPLQIEHAKSSQISAKFSVGDITKIEFSKNKFDAVFVFGVLHHVPLWKEAIKALYRVIRPQGLLLIEEINEDASQFFKKYLHFAHPKKAQFSWKEFIHQLEKNGFEIIDYKNLIFEVFRSYLCVK